MEAITYEIRLDSYRLEMLNILRSYPESKNLNLMHNNKVMNFTGKNSIEYRNWTTSSVYYYSLKVILLSWKNDDFGDYYLQYDYEGKTFQKPYAKLVRKGMFYFNEWSCEWIEKLLLPSFRNGV